MIINGLNHRCTITDDYDKELDCQQLNLLIKINIQTPREKAERKGRRRKQRKKGEGRRRYGARTERREGEKNLIKLLKLMSIARKYSR